MRWIPGGQGHAGRFWAGFFWSQFVPGRSFLHKPWPLPPPSTRCPHPTLHSRKFPEHPGSTCELEGSPERNLRAQMTVTYAGWLMSIVLATLYQQSSLDHNRMPRQACNCLEGLLGLETYCADFHGGLQSLTCILHPFRMVPPNAS